MKTIARTIITLSTVAVMTVSFNGLAFAGGTAKTSDVPSGCVPVYGGGWTCPTPPNIMIDKKVANPATGYYVDNLSVYDPKFRPQQLITFQIVVKNPGDQKLENIVVTDTLPTYVDYMSGPGTYDTKTRQFTFTVSLNGHESQTYYLKGRIVHEAALSNENVSCQVNVAEARSGDLADKDESQFCVEKKLIVPQVPKAGPENWIITLSGLVSSMGLGNYLRKKSRRV